MVVQLEMHAVQRDFSRVGNMNCCFAHCTATTQLEIRHLQSPSRWGAIHRSFAMSSCLTPAGQVAHDSNIITTLPNKLLYSRFIIHVQTISHPAAVGITWYYVVLKNVPNHWFYIFCISSIAQLMTGKSCRDRARSVPEVMGRCFFFSQRNEDP